MSKDLGIAMKALHWQNLIMTDSTTLLCRDNKASITTNIPVYVSILSIVKNVEILLRLCSLLA